MNLCQWMTVDEDGDGAYFSEFDEDFCCGEPAMWKRWGSYFCADHYDKLCAMYGEPKPEEDL